MPLRIVGSKEVPATSALNVFDASTGANVDDIVQLDLSLSASPRWITARVTVYERNERGQRFRRDDVTAQKTEDANVVEVDITTRDSEAVS